MLASERGLNDSLETESTRAIGKNDHTDLVWHGGHNQVVTKPSVMPKQVTVP